MNRTVWKRLILIGWLCFYATATAWTESVDAPLNGVANFTGSGDKTFRVNSGRDLKLTDFKTVEGDGQVVWTPGEKTSVGGKVEIGSVDSTSEKGYYLASGTFISTGGVGGIGGGGGGGSNKWDAGYNKSTHARIYLEVNEPGIADNDVFEGDEGGYLTVRILGGSPDSTYNVSLESIAVDDSDEDEPIGEVEFSSDNVDVDGDGSTVEVQLHGREYGRLKIRGTATSSPEADEGKVNANVIELEIANDE